MNNTIIMFSSISVDECRLGCDILGNFADARDDSPSGHVISLVQLVPGQLAQLQERRSGEPEFYCLNFVQNNSLIFVLSYIHTFFNTVSYIII